MHAWCWLGFLLFGILLFCFLLRKNVYQQRSVMGRETGRRMDGWMDGWRGGRDGRKAGSKERNGIGGARAWASEALEAPPPPHTYLAFWHWTGLAGLGSGAASCFLGLLVWVLSRYY